MRMPVGLIGLFSLLLAACGGSQEPDQIGGDTTAERNRLATIAQRVTIVRDDYGIPHVYGKTDADTVFGMIYAQAEDDFPRVERNYYWAIGRLAEVEGEDALMSDLRARLYMTEAEARAAYDAAPDWLKELCDAWADGLNYFLLVNLDVKPKLITKFEPWMPFYFFEGSIGGDIEQIPLRGISAFYGGKEIKEAGLNEWEPRGSNGFAISGEHTQSGNAMLLINPHTSFYFRGEMHMVSEEGLNAYGAVTWGQFFIYQGFNEDTGWMHTSTYADFKDEFVEDIFEDENGDLMYRYGNEVRPVETYDVTLKYKTDDGEMAEKTYPAYRTHHGPITHEIDGKWVATKINWDPVNALRQSFLRTKQADHDEFREMMDIRTNSSNNTVYADSSGNIAYYHGNFMPLRDDTFDYSKPVDGSNPATDWKGLHEVEDMITLLNPENGWLQNCNSTPYTAAAEFSPKREDFPAYMAPDNENYRAVHAIDLLEELGTPEQDKLTLDSLIDLAYDNHLPAFEVLFEGMLEEFQRIRISDETVIAAMPVLENWDYRVTADSVAMTIAHVYATNVLQSGLAPSGLSGMERIAWYGSEAFGEKVKYLSQSLADIERDFGSWNTPWGEVNRFQRLTGDIDLGFDDNAPSLPVGLASGRWGALAAYGARRGEDTKRIYGYRGNSFVAVVEFGDKVKAKSLLAGGQSGDPDSPHFFDQAQLYLDAEFKDVPFYKEDVDARAQRTYSPGE